METFVSLDFYKEFHLIAKGIVTTCDMLGKLVLL